MGTLYYGNTQQPIEIADRVLAHVKVVVATKLRRGESFTLSWRHTDDVPGARSTIWLHPSIPLRFAFGSPEAETLDPVLLRELVNAANSASGMAIDVAAPSVEADAAAPRAFTAA